MLIASRWAYASDIGGGRICRVGIAARHPGGWRGGAVGIVGRRPRLSATLGITNEAGEEAAAEAALTGAWQIEMS